MRELIGVALFVASVVTSLRGAFMLHPGAGWLAIGLLGMAAAIALLD